MAEQELTQRNTTGDENKNSEDPGNDPGDDTGKTDTDVYTAVKKEKKEKVRNWSGWVFAYAMIVATATCVFGVQTDSSYGPYEMAFIYWHHGTEIPISIQFLSKNKKIGNIISIIIAVYCAIGGFVCILSFLYPNLTAPLWTVISIQFIISDVLAVATGVAIMMSPSPQKIKKLGFGLAIHFVGIGCGILNTTIQFYVTRDFDLIGTWGLNWVLQGFLLPIQIYYFRHAMAGKYDHIPYISYGKTKKKELICKGIVLFMAIIFGPVFMILLRHFGTTPVPAKPDFRFANTFWAPWVFVMALPFGGMGIFVSIYLYYMYENGDDDDTK